MTACEDSPNTNSTTLYDSERIQALIDQGTLVKVFVGLVKLTNLVIVANGPYYLVVKDSQGETGFLPHSKITSIFTDTRNNHGN